MVDAPTDREVLGRGRPVGELPLWPSGAGPAARRRFVPPCHALPAHVGMTPPVRQRPLPPTRTARFGHGGVSTGAATFLGSPLVIALLRLRGSGHGVDINHAGQRITGNVTVVLPSRSSRCLTS